jgi:hypothetical protein
LFCSSLSAPQLLHDYENLNYIHSREWLNNAVCSAQISIIYLTFRGLSWPWSYGSWIYSYLCNQCLSPLMLWARISIMARCTTLCDNIFSVTGDRSVVFSRSSGFLHQQILPPRYNKNIVERHENPSNKQTNILLLLSVIFRLFSQIIFSQSETKCFVTF